tara:strand:- start:5440 stop:5976 length:537 start_codon:yes stop_codon:yes gene_type:complete
MEWLKKVAELHRDWVRIVVSMGEDVYAEDIVQEMYIRLTKYYRKHLIINEDGKVNKSYIYLVLRAMVCDLHKQKKKMQKISIDKVQQPYVIYDYISKNDAELSLEALINDEMQNWEYFDQELFKLYRNSGLSMRKISAETKISTKTIFYSIKRSKENLRKNIAEDYEDFINGDYELIK